MAPVTPEEWLEIVRWVESQDVRVTADVAAKFGVALKQYEAAQVSTAVGRLVANKNALTLAGIKREIRSKSSRWREPLEKRHRELFPHGCNSPICDICLTPRNVSLQSAV